MVYLLSKITKFERKPALARPAKSGKAFLECSALAEPEIPLDTTNFCLVRLKVINYLTWHLLELYFVLPVFMGLKPFSFFFFNLPLICL
jgi:hypothetical protein